MRYLYVTHKANYKDYAAGRVLLSYPGAAPFPVRLLSELFRRGAAFLEAAGSPGPYTLYDPCCGTGYLLTVLGYLHGARLRALSGSDIDPVAIEFARQNLALLTAEGLAARTAQLEDWAARFGKASHREALESAQRLKTRLPGALAAACFTADAARLEDAAPPVAGVDMVITDVPYGRSAQWAGGGAPDDTISRLLAGVRPVLAAPAVVVIVSAKGQTARHPAYRRVTRLSAGKRLVTMLAPVDA
ncbi:MAG: hypothetical protein JXB47_21045 [Anaerolineae bacterium]|nr:hypothetical protein [Anaerolineae bacterium]